MRGSSGGLGLDHGSDGGGSGGGALVPSLSSERRRPSVEPGGGGGLDPVPETRTSAGRPVAVVQALRTGSLSSRRLQRSTTDDPARHRAPVDGPSPLQPGSPSGTARVRSTSGGGGTPTTPAAAPAGVPPAGPGSPSRLAQPRWNTNATARVSAASGGAGIDRGGSLPSPVSPVAADKAAHPVTRECHLFSQWGGIIGMGRGWKSC
eukprot:22052-Chlamydomonas_euryale.AAC.1